jgi:hypothetical protein
VSASVEARAELARVRAAFLAGTLSCADLDRLDALLTGKPARQRILYLHALSPYLGAAVVSAALHEPEPGGLATIDPTTDKLPYETVHDAIVDGWQVVQFPDPRSPFDDEEIDVLGYQFVLQQLDPRT